MVTAGLLDASVQLAGEFWCQQWHLVRDTGRWGAVSPILCWISRIVEIQTLHSTHMWPSVQGLAEQSSGPPTAPAPLPVRLRHCFPLSQTDQRMGQWGPAQGKG